MNGVGRLNTTCETTVSIPEDSDEAKEVIEVQILPQVRRLNVVVIVEVEIDSG
jgi:hypothetical protein